MTKSEYKLTPSPIVREDEALELSGMRRSAFRVAVREGRFPKPLRLGPRAVGWRLDEIMEWQNGLQRVQYAHE